MGGVEVLPGHNGRSGEAAARRVAAGSDTYVDAILAICRVNDGVEHAICQNPSQQPSRYALHLVRLDNGAIVGGFLKRRRDELCLHRREPRARVRARLHDGEGMIARRHPTTNTNTTAHTACLLLVHAPRHNNLAAGADIFWMPRRP